MRLFHKTSKENATAILRNGFKDRTNPSGGNFGFGDQIPPITDAWFSDIPLDANEGLNSTKWGTLDGDASRLFLLEIPDEAIEQLKNRDGWHGKFKVEHTPDEIADMEEFGAHYQEYLITAEVANQYGPPIDVTDYEEEYMPMHPPRPDRGAFIGNFDIGEFLWMDKPNDWMDK